MFSIRPTWDNIENYQAARERYESIDPIKFKKQDNTDHYGTDCRPLGRRNAPWIRIEKGVEKLNKNNQSNQNNQTQTEGTGFSSPVTTYFDCVFYRTVMVRYYEDGRIVVAPNGIEKHLHTVSSANFLHHTLPRKYKCWTEAGMLVVHGFSNENVSRGIVPYNGESLELDVGVCGFKNAQPAFYVVLNRAVTKLHREKMKEIIDQAYALAAIIDGADVHMMTWGEDIDRDAWTPERVLYWMQCNFASSGWSSDESGSSVRYRRIFTVPSREDFNKKFFPQYYFTVEHARDPNTDPSLFVLKEVGADAYLRRSNKWYGLHKDDPRHETHPNII